MITNKPSPTGDFLFGIGYGAYLSQEAAVLQNIINSIRVILREWFLDTTAGVPWFDPAFQRIDSKVQCSALDSYLRSVILRCYGVNNIAEYVSIYQGGGVYKYSTIVLISGFEANLEVLVDFNSLSTNVTGNIT